MKRRDFLKVVGIVSGSVVSGCKLEKAEKKLVSYMLPPEEGIIPGEPYYLASTCTECPAGCGLTVKLRDDRPVKLEGNRLHPVNEGTLCMRGQASLAHLYHPERLKEPLYKGLEGTFAPISWDRAVDLIRTALGASGKDDLANFYLSGRTTGSLDTLIRHFCGTRGFERPLEIELFNYGASRKAYDLLFGMYVLPTVHLHRADLWVTLGADLFETYVNPVHFSREYAKATKQENFHWIHFEPHFSLTGANSSSRLTINPGSEPYLLIYLLRHLGRNTGTGNALPEGLPAVDLETLTKMTGLREESIQSLLQRVDAAEHPVFLAGGPATSNQNGSITALLTGLLQWRAGNVGSIVDFSSPENFDNVGTLNDLETLSDRLQDTPAGVLFLSRLHGTPLGSTLEALSSNAAFSVALADTLEPWMNSCKLILPLSHSLESWGDVRSRKDVESLIQPVIHPLHNTLSEGDFLLKLLGDTRTYQEYLFGAWEGYGESWIDTGVNTQTPLRTAVNLDTDNITKFLESEDLLPEPPRGEHLLVVPSIRTYDGRSREITLLEEIPDPLTTVTYGDWISVSPEDAGRLGLADGDEIKLSSDKFSGEEAIALPVCCLPGLRPSTFVVSIDVAANLKLPVDRRTGELILSLGGLSPEKTGNHVKLPVLSGSRDAKARGILPHENKSLHHQKNVSLYPDHDHENYLWGMAIDLDACIGCSACVAACYIENNVPITGYQEHLKGREMAWIRISPYGTGDGRLEFIPVMCQQCEHAPCEPVCPVYATYHNMEGLNVQIYNRCVGTRYCANNCPYKARRFNWFDHKLKEPLHLMLNPDVSKRPQGVMEKCTFCIQRIRYAKGKAKDAGRLVEDGEAIPACAETCPTGAITFGNLLDNNSKISELARSPSAYRILEQLGTRPSVIYLKKAGNEHES